ncbi:family 43 glycosylhydrolase [Shewanella sp. C32]|uniref:Family 43 glycosylhydrolase n=1 Tax=Shewanella electrica TaxID=515560 RepID=A0ABT2FLF7_9GAMM|nr:LamG-like jellyroll fold domain-containing protein [Shewanella electrica]MCH1925524.1 family 43 glycosylhydrolase [Shewanella electrica]MCS4557169.1 family 43 glycosylhydrolase [Shewanella electrica]
MVFQRSLVSLGIVLSLASCGGNDSDNSTNDTDPFAIPEAVTVADPTISGEVNYSNVSVHDPSIVRDNDGTYYVFGSHMAYAKSTDLMHWERLNPSLTTPTGEDANAYAVKNTPLFNTYESEIAEGIAWVKNNVGSWAPDVKKLGDGKYHFFFDHCAGNGDNGTACWRRSYLGVASSDSITGPYVNDGIFLKSDQQAGEEDQFPDGATPPYDMNANPNAIDPAVFNDSEGNLWMTYGSYSGGIFVLQLDPNSGKPLPDQGWGTHIAGGNLAPIEGSYVIYSPENQYYYLFMSFAGFASDGGYNIRVARSTSPDGPYLDAAGQDMVNAASTNLDILGNYGTKLLGGFLFDKQAGDAGTDHGYMSPGHNSAYYDQATGKYYLVFHTRFPGRGEGHEVRVHEMFINKDGWLVASPTRYAPITGNNIVDEVDVEGAYQFIDQQHDNNTEAHVSDYIRLKRTWTNRGEIQGAHTGRYEMDDANHITLIFDDLGTYEGVLAWQYDDNTQKLVPTFSALNGISSVIAIQLPESDVSATLTNIANAIVLPTSTTTNLNLIDVGTQDATITWSSSDPSVVKPNGEVIRPAGGAADATVTLTATITLNGQTITKQYTITIPARFEYNRVASYTFDGNLSDSLQHKADGTYAGPGLADAQGSAAYAAGQSSQALALDGSYAVKLPAGLINSTEYTVSLWFKANSFTDHTPVFFGAASADAWASLVPQAWDGNIMVWSNNNGTWYDGRSMVKATAGQWTHLAYAVDHGAIKIYVNGEETFAGANFPDLYTNVLGTFAVGGNLFADPLFNGDIDELRVYDAALSAEDVKALDIDHADSATLLQSAVNQLTLGDISNVTDDLRLKVSGSYASLISWQSSNPSFIATDGTVVRPETAEGDQEVTLTATISLDGATDTKTFVATVKAKGTPTPIAKFSFDNDDLTDATGHFAAGTPTGRRLIDTGGTITYADGVVGKALVMNGSTGVKLPNNMLDDDTYTFAMWINPKALSMFTTAFFGYANEDNYVSLVPGGNNAAAGKFMVWSGNVWFDAIASEKLPLDTWSHVTFVNNAGQVALYLNGEQVYSGVNFPNIFGKGGTIGFALGANFWDDSFNGMLDEVTLFDEPLTADEVQQFYISAQAAD